jgi:hypothetical protein
MKPNQPHLRANAAHSHSETSSFHQLYCVDILCVLLTGSSSSQAQMSPSTSTFADDCPRNPDRPPPKRRKRRRGTSSCLECYRRHVRCDYEPGHSAVCVPCRRRGCKCLPVRPSQHPEDGIGGGYQEVGKRIDQVESLVMQLIHQRGDAGNGGSSSHGDWSTSLSQPASTHRLIRPTPSRVLHHSSANLPNPLMLDPSRSNAVSRLIYSFFPSQEVTTLILRRGDFFGIPLQIFTQSFNKLASSTDPGLSPKAPTLPTQSAPPVQLARSLLQLAICLQQINPDSPGVGELRLESPARSLSAKYFEAASRYVTSQDSLLGTLEGIETLMLEGLYHVNSGGWKQAWLSFRRALSIAHLMGLHVSVRSREAGTRSPETSSLAQLIWFRLNYFDRFLSLLVRLPSYLDSRAWERGQIVAPDASYGKLEQLHAVIMERIISRNEQMRRTTSPDTPAYDHAKETRDIDYDLNNTARTLPVRWWSIPTIAAGRHMEQTVRLLMQLHQYNLLLLLHMPYILEEHHHLQGITNPDEASCRHRYHKLAAVNASREVLSRFIVYHNFTNLPQCCPGTGIKGLIASMALLLAHIDRRRHVCAVVLEHQRPHDLGLVDHTIESIEATSRHTCDELSYSALFVLRKLLAIENEATEGAEFAIQSRQGHIGDVHCAMKEAENRLDLSVPYLGDFAIVRL